MTKKSEYEQQMEVKATLKAILESEQLIPRVGAVAVQI